MRRPNLCRRLFARHHTIVIHEWIQLHAEPIDVGPVVQFVTDEQAGGIAVFLGTTRAEAASPDRQLAALDYEAYPEMALRQMRQLAQQARQRWPVRRVAILHRTGRVLLGEPSVIIAVSTPRRADAFDACRWIIDALKADVAIWKKEIWEDGTQSWVQPQTRGRGDAG